MSSGADHNDLDAELAALTSKHAWLITPIAGGDRLAAACAMAGIDAEAVSTEIGAIAQLADPLHLDASAISISRLLGKNELLAVERADGLLTINSWAEGAKVKKLAPGLVLDGAPSGVLDLLSGSGELAELGEVFPSSKIGKFAAFRLLRKKRK